ncbi:MAG: anthranilate synthase component I [bacterium]|nr:anthranilate synthase component I [bacterium]
MNIYPDNKTFRKHAEEYTHIPVIAEVPGDLETPVSVYLKLRDESEYSFLLESAMQSGSSGRYSFIGFDPVMVIRYSSGILNVKEDGEWNAVDRDPLDFLRELVRKHRLPVLDESLPPFCGGLVGFFSYDSITYFEDGVKFDNKNDKADDFLLVLTYDLVVFDHYQHTLNIINIAEAGDDPPLSYEKAMSRISQINEKINIKLKLHDNGNQGDKCRIQVTANDSKKGFIEKVEIAKEHIRNGDVFQLVLSQRFEIPLENDEFEIYRALRRTNPSPYMFYLSLDDMIITGSSPEVLVKCTDEDIITRPLAGTRKRGSSMDEDKMIIDDLLSDEKEKAEHIMLVDLGRNDIGRLSNYGSVKVSEFMGIEKYSHVIHIVSEVTGKLDSKFDYFDVLKYSFPAGTVTGAPKIRAMELIDRYENGKRGVYAGTVGYFDFHNNMDACIAIRTIIIKDKTAYIQAGAGIVADSIPENEYYETINKAGALFKAISEAEGKEYDISDR